MQVTLTRKRLVVLIVLVLTVGGWLLGDWLVTTDAERIDTILGELATAVEQNDVEPIVPFLDDSFRLLGMNTEEWHAWYGELLKLMHVEAVRRVHTKVKIDEADPDRAIAAVRTYIDLAPPGPSGPVDWRLEFQRRGEHDWKLRGVRAYYVPNGPEFPLQNTPSLVR